MFEKKRDNWMTGLKGIACVMVVNLHLLACYFPDAQNAEIQFLGSGVYNYIQLTPLGLLFNGSFAVYIFWLMSAFVLTKKYIGDGNRYNLLKVQIRKYFRLLFICVVIELVAFFLINYSFYKNIYAGKITNSIFWQYERDYSGYDIKSLLNEILWGDFFKQSFVIPPLWTIKYEFLGCALITILLTTMGKINKKFILFLTILMFGTGQIPYFCFIAGYIMAYMDTPKNNKSGFMVFVVGLFLGAYPPTGIPVGGVYYYIYEFFLKYMEESLLYFNGSHLVYVVASCCVVYGIVNCEILQNIFKLKGFVLLGLLSPFIYLVHIPVLFSIDAEAFISIYGITGNIIISSLLGWVIEYFIVIIIACLFFAVNRRYIDGWVKKITDYMMS